MRSPVMLTALIPVCFLASAALGGELIRIDDTTLLDPDTGAVITGRPVEQLPAAQGDRTEPSFRSPNDGFAGCSSSDDCTPFDLFTYMAGAGINLLPEGNYPYDATLSPSGLEVWIPGASGDGVIVIDRATNTITQRIPVGDYPISVAFSKDQTMALVPCRGTEEIKIISTNTYTVGDSLSVPTTYLGAGNIALDPVSGNFYMVDWFGDDLYEIAPDGSAILNQVTLGSSLWQLVVAPGGQEIYVTDRGTDQVRVIDQATLTQIGAWSVGDDPWGIDVTEDGSKLVVACEDSHDIRIIDTASGAITALLLESTADPRDVDIRDDQATAYVAGGTLTTGNVVFRIDLTTDTVAGSFPVSGTNVNVVAVQAQRVDTPTGVRSSTIAATPHLSAHPTPFRSSTSIRYSLANPAHVRLAVCDVAGRIVRRLDAGWRIAGEHGSSWDGRDDRGHRVSSGIYLVRLDNDGTVTTRKVVRRSE